MEERVLMKFIIPSLLKSCVITNSVSYNTCQTFSTLHGENESIPSVRKNEKRVLTFPAFT